MYMAVRIATVRTVMYLRAVCLVRAIADDLDDDLRKVC